MKVEVKMKAEMEIGMKVEVKEMEVETGGCLIYTPCINQSVNYLCTGRHLNYLGQPLHSSYNAQRLEGVSIHAGLPGV